MTQAVAARGRWTAFSLLAVTAFVLILDAAIVNVAIVSIGKELRFEPADLSWVASAYALTFGGFLLLGGRLSDLYGRRRLFMGGLALFTIASFLGSLAQTPLQLILARAGQGLGAALVAPAALALVMTLFPDGSDRNKALGLWGAIAGTGAAAGSILGGVLTEYLGWESVLWVNVPVGIAAIALAPRLLPEARDPSVGRSLDLAGAITVTGGLALLVYVLVDANDAGWTSAQTLGLGALALGLLVAFVIIELRAKQPLVPLGIFRKRTLRGANVVSILTTMALFPMFFYLSQYLQYVLAYEPVKAGLGQLPIALTILVVAAAAGPVVTRLGFRAPLIIGFALVAAGLVWFAQASANGGYASDMLGPMIVAGVGGALVFVPATIAATAGVPGHEAGLASGLINTSQQIGGALGLGALVAVATARSEDVVAAGEQNPLVVLTEGFQAAFLVGAGLALAAALLAIVLLPGRKSALAEVTPPAEPVVVPEPEPVAVAS